MLGGSFSSRLNMNLREKHGYTVRRELDVRHAHVRRSVLCRRRRADRQDHRSAEGILQRAERHSASRCPPTSSRARRTTSRCGFPAASKRRATSRAGSKTRLVYHLPDDYFSTYVQKIQAVTAADVQRVAQKYITPDRFAVVVVGDRKAIEPAIRTLNLGPIKTMTVDDVFGPKP